MKISVITVCKNAEKALESTIVAVLQQTYSNIEYIIIDGNSEDGTKSIIEKYSSNIYCLLSEVDTGVYQAMNKGIKRATGDLLYFANAGDKLYNHEVLEKLSNIFCANPSIDLIYGDHEAYLTSGDRKIYSKVALDKVLDEVICIGDHQPLQPATLFKSEAFKRIGLFNENYKLAADYDWFLRYFSYSESRPYYYPHPIVCYRHGGLSSNIRMLFTEIFAIQAQAQICQTPASIDKRLNKLEQMFIDKYALLERTNNLSLERLNAINFLELELANSNKLSLERLERINCLEGNLKADLINVLSRLKKFIKNVF